MCFIISRSQLRISVEPNFCLLIRGLFILIVLYKAAFCVLASVYEAKLFCVELSRFFNKLFSGGRHPISFWTASVSFFDATVHGRSDPQMQFTISRQTAIRREWK